MFALATGGSRRALPLTAARRAGRRGDAARGAQRRARRHRRAASRRCRAPRTSAGPEPRHPRRTHASCFAALVLALLRRDGLVSCAEPRRRPSHPPIVFVHGNGDSAGVVADHVVALREQRLAARSPGARSTCPTPPHATTTTKPQPGRSSADDQMRSSLAAEVDTRAQGHRRATGGADGQLARRQRDPRLRPQRRRRAARCRTPSSAARPATASGPTRRFRPDNEFNGTGPVPDRAECAQGAAWRRGDTGRALDDDPFRQQRQVRAARRRVDRRQRHARPTSPSTGRR